MDADIFFVLTLRGETTAFCKLGYRHSDFLEAAVPADFESKRLKILTVKLLACTSMSYHRKWLYYAQGRDYGLFGSTLGLIGSPGGVI